MNSFCSGKRITTTSQKISRCELMEFVECPMRPIPSQQAVTAERSWNLRRLWEQTCSRLQTLALNHSNTFWAESCDIEVFWVEKLGLFQLTRHRSFWVLWSVIAGLTLTQGHTLWAEDIMGKWIRWLTDSVTSCVDLLSEKFLKFPSSSWIFLF